MNTYILFIYGVFDDQQDVDFFCMEVIGQSELLKSQKYVIEGNKNLIVSFESDLDYDKLNEEIYTLCFNDNIKFYFLFNTDSIISVNLPEPVNDYIFKNNSPINSMMKIEFKKISQEKFNLDEILDKLNQVGIESLTPEEKNFLDNFEK